MGQIFSDKLSDSAGLGFIAFALNGIAIQPFRKPKFVSCPDAWVGCYNSEWFAFLIDGNGLE